MADTLSLPVLTNPTATDKLNTTGVLHDVQHDDLNDLIEVWTAKIGIDSSAVTTALDYLIQHGVHPKDFYFSGIISPTSLAASQNNYAPTNFATANVVRQNCSANVDITGLAGGASLGNGRFLIWFNISTSNSQTLKNESGSSTAANRFSNGADVTIPAGQSVLLWYDVTATRWKTLALPVAGGGSGAPTTEKYLIADTSAPGTLPNSVAIGTAWGADLAGTGSTLAAPIVKDSHTGGTIKTHHAEAHDILDAALHVNFAWGTPPGGTAGSATTFPRSDHTHPGGGGGSSGGIGVASLAGTPVSIANSTTDTLLIGYTIPANELAAGSIYAFMVGWTATNTSGTNRSVAIKIKLGGTLMYTVSSAMNTGVSGKLTMHGSRIRFITVGASSTTKTVGWNQKDASNADVNVDLTAVAGPSTTVNRDIEIYAALSAASALYTADFHVATIDKVKA